MTDDLETTDARASAVRRHFHEWHGAAPDDIEIAALLKSIDRTVFRAQAETRVLADCERTGVKPVKRRETT